MITEEYLATWMKDVVNIHTKQGSFKTGIKEKRILIEKMYRRSYQEIHKRGNASG